MSNRSHMKSENGSVDVSAVEDVDVVVIGGGPAGASCATVLALSGSSVRVLEGKRFPRHHIGESLLAASIPLLDEIGALPRMKKADFLPKSGSLFVWAGEHIGLGMPDPGYAFQVTRSAFDRLLLDHASDSGVDVWFEQWVKSVGSRDPGGVVTVRSDGEHGPTVHRARLVVDASGLFQFMPRRHGMTIDTFGPPRVAVSAYFHGADRVEGEHRTNVISEAADDGWLWFIPLSDDLTSVGFVGDAEDLSHGTDEQFARQIRSSTVVRGLLGRSTQRGSGRLLRYTNHMVREPLWQHGRVLVGDSAFFVDPLFSTGVHGALLSGVSAGSAAVSVLSGDLSEDAAARWYDDTMREHHERIRCTVELLYGLHEAPSRFWRSRRLADMTPSAADRLATGLGALGIDLFRRTSGDERLRLPDSLARTLPEFGGTPRHTVLPRTPVALAPGVAVRRAPVRWRNRLVGGVSVTHARNRLHPVRLPLAHPGAMVVDDLSRGPVPMHRWQGDRHAAAVIRVLSGTGLVQPVAV